MYVTSDKTNPLNNLPFRPPDVWRHENLKTWKIAAASVVSFLEVYNHSKKSRNREFVFFFFLVLQQKHKIYPYLLLLTVSEILTKILKMKIPSITSKIHTHYAHTYKHIYIYVCVFKIAYIIPTKILFSNFDNCKRSWQ